MTPSALTHEEAERLREILIQHDKNSPTKQREFDLAKPPVPAYRHQEYPRMVYHQDGSTGIVHDDAEMEDATAAGWLKSPFVEAAPEPVEAPKRTRSTKTHSE